MGQPKQHGSLKGSIQPFLIKDGRAIFVSVNGDDSADGSLEHPLRTLEGAIALARNGDSAEKTTVYFRKGTYHVPETINMSYTAKWYAPLIISSFKNEPVTFNAGEEIPLRKMVPAAGEFTDKIIDKPAKGKILQYDLAAAGITDYGEISVRGHLISEEKEAQAELSLDGTVQRLAGWPDNGFTGLIAPDDDSEEYGKRSKAGIAGGCSFSVNYDRPSQWSRPAEAWLSGTLGPNYEFDHYPVERFDSAEKRVYLKQGALEKYYTAPYYRFENVPEELDTPGEYYIDRNSGMLYFYPPAAANKSSVITITMPTRNGRAYQGKSPDDMFRLEGCRNIKFRNLTFKGGRGSAFTGNNNDNIIFENCDINSFGANGIRFDYSSGIEIRGCKIHDVGQDGIQFTSCGDYSRLVPNYNVVCNNEIFNFARLERSYKTGINLGYRCVGATVCRNHIYNGPHSGLIFYGVNNDIYGNEFDNLVTEFSDMDAVYANNSNFPWERGNRIHMNYFHDIGRSSMNGSHQINVRAIRTDNKGNGLDIYGNLFYNIGDGGAAGKGNNAVGAITAEGTRNKITGNLFVDCNETYTNAQAYREITAAPDGTLYADNAVINGAAAADLKKQMKSYLPVYGVQFPELYNYFYEHPNYSKTNVFKDNMIINIAFPLSAYNGAPNAEGYRGSDKLVDASGNYVAKTDPGFAAYYVGDFELSQAARGLVKDFPNIRMDLFGTR